MGALSSQSAESLIEDLGAFLRDTMKNHNVSIGDLIQVHPLWPNNTTTGGALSPLSPQQFRHHCNLNVINKDIIKFISMGLLIEYYSSGTVNEDGSSCSLYKNVMVARTAQYAGEPKPTGIKYMSNNTSSLEDFKPSLVTISYFSTTTHEEVALIDLSKPESEEDDNQKLLQAGGIANTSKKKHSIKAKKCSPAEKKIVEQRKSFRDIKEPTNRYLKALDQEVNRKQQQTSNSTTTRRAYNSKKTNKRQKTSEADSLAYDVDSCQSASFNFSNGNAMHHTSPVSDYFSPPSTNYIIDKPSTRHHHHTSSRKTLHEERDASSEPKETGITTVCN